MLSVLLTLFTTHNIEATMHQVFVVLFPLALIFWSEFFEQSFRRYDYQGRGHGGEPAPGFVVQIIAWIVLIVLGYWRFLLVAMMTDT
ncbi:hypothetical protein DTL42_10380 [Bremerella cremea]|uniref:Uncharacterized protein n=2 Tax=Bremerella cremea TaxID=1031537 RepID=A0A368KRS2_9BACT|nr:hypothetical protein DTL42_10380 [Bremerella cremea]